MENNGNNKYYYKVERDILEKIFGEKEYKNDFPIPRCIYELPENDEKQKLYGIWLFLVVNFGHKFIQNQSIPSWRIRSALYEYCSYNYLKDHNGVKGIISWAQKNQLGIEAQENTIEEHFKIFKSGGSNGHNTL